VVDWIRDNPMLSGSLFGVSLVLSLACFIGVPLLLVRIPSDYFARERHPPLAKLAHRPVVRAILLVLKNLIGAGAFLAGVVALFTPGQGLLGIAIGIALMDFPGKHALERRIIGQRRVLRGINKLRAKAGRPPLEVGDASPKAREKHEASSAS
jgi:hypothetical protein